MGRSPGHGLLGAEGIRVAGAGKSLLERAGEGPAGHRQPAGMSSEQADGAAKGKAPGPRGCCRRALLPQSARRAGGALGRWEKGSGKRRDELVGGGWVAGGHLPVPQFPRGWDAAGGSQPWGFGPRVSAPLFPLKKNLSSSQVPFPHLLHPAALKSQNPTTKGTKQNHPPSLGQPQAKERLRTEHFHQFLRLRHRLQTFSSGPGREPAELPAPGLLISSRSSLNPTRCSQYCAPGAQRFIPGDIWCAPELRISTGGCGGLGGLLGSPGSPSTGPRCATGPWRSSQLPFNSFPSCVASAP